MSGNQRKTQLFEQQLSKEVNDVIASNQRNIYRTPIKKQRGWFDGLPTGKTELFAVTAMILISLWLFGWQLMPFNKVNHLVVTGTVYADPQTLIANSHIRSLDSIKEVMAQRDTIEKNIKDNNPTVASVVFERNQWQQLEMKVTEYYLVSLVNVNGQLTPLLENGSLIENLSSTFNANQASAQLPILKNGINKSNLQQVATALRRLDVDTLKLIESIEISENLNKPNTLNLKMRDGLFVKAIATTLADKLIYYPKMKAIIGNQTGTINLEVGAYFTPTTNNANSIKLDNNLDN